MAPPEVQTPAISSVDKTIEIYLEKPPHLKVASIPPPIDSLLHLAITILHNLQHQHDWTYLRIRTDSSSGKPFPRPMIFGLPPRRVYVHPDEQVEIVKAEHKTGKPIEQHPELEWVLPTHLYEKWSLAKFAAVFDAIDNVPSAGTDADVDLMEGSVGHEWRWGNRQKRVLLATLQDDSTVVYYIMHDGIVKPRQN